HTELAARGVVQRKILGGVLAGLEVGVLADVERALRTLEESIDVAADRSDGRSVCVPMPRGPGQRIRAQVFGLDGAELFEVDVLPVAVGRVLVDAAPDRIDEGARGVQRVP